MAARLFSSRSTMSHLHGPCGTPREYGAASEETSRRRWSMGGDAGFEPQWRSALFRCCHDRCEQFLRVEDRNGRLREVDAIPGDDRRRPGVSRSFMQHLSLIHISEPTRLGMISYAVFCLKKKKTQKTGSRT